MAHSDECAAFLHTPPLPCKHYKKIFGGVDTVCTAISDNTNGFLFGRTLDLEHSYGERIILTPRHKRLNFLHQTRIGEHPAILGIGILQGDTPLYFDAINESGLAIAALNFPKSAIYRDVNIGKRNLASFEVIPHLLSSCKSLDDAKAILNDVNITCESVSEELPASPLHWLIADRCGAIVLESTGDGLKIHENPFGVLTNEPPFPYHAASIASYLHLSSEPPENKLAPSVDIAPLSRGAGALGLPGDLSSPSRFIRAVFMKEHADKAQNTADSVSRFFHIMDSVCVPKGAIKTDSGASVYTVYTSCADPEHMRYCFTTYSSRRIREISPTECEMQGSSTLSFPIAEREHITRLSFT